VGRQTPLTRSLFSGGSSGSLSGLSPSSPLDAVQLDVNDVRRFMIIIDYFGVLCIIKLNLCIFEMSNRASLKTTSRSWLLGWKGMKIKKLILRKLNKIVATKCQILRLKSISAGDLLLTECERKER